MAVRALLDVGDRSAQRHGRDDVIVLPEGGELEAKEIRPVLLAFGRIRRLERKIARSRSRWRTSVARRQGGRPSRSRSRGIARHPEDRRRHAAQAGTDRRPRRQVRRLCQRIDSLALEARRNRTARWRAS